jgi:hypothetical protein
LNPIRAYYILTATSPSHPSSVQKKVTEQIAALKLHGIEAIGLFFSTEIKEEMHLSDGIRFIPVFFKPEGYFRLLRERRAFEKAIEKYTKSKVESDAKIYFRYVYASRYLLRFFRAFRGRIVVNHVTSEIPEIQLYKPNQDSGLVSRVLGLIENKWIPIFQEIIFGSRMRALAKCAVVNSVDIGEYENTISTRKYRYFIIPDGVKAEAFPKHQAPVIDGIVRMVFLKGATTDAVYNGIDRLVVSLQQSQYRDKFTLTIIGPNQQEDMKMVQKMGMESQVFFKDFMSKEALDIELNQYHLGVSTLALHRKGIRSTSTIKSREYCARGIPFIFGHHDPDLSESNLNGRYFMEFPADESLIDFSKVYDFISRLYENNLDMEVLRSFAKESLDQSVKMQKLKQVLLDESMS